MGGQHTSIADTGGGGVAAPPRPAPRQKSLPDDAEQSRSIADRRHGGTQAKTASGDLGGAVIDGAAEVIGKEARQIGSSGPVAKGSPASPPPPAPATEKLTGRAERRRLKKQGGDQSGPGAIAKQDAGKVIEQKKKKPPSVATKSSVSPGTEKAKTVVPPKRKHKKEKSGQADRWASKQEDPLKAKVEEIFSKAALFERTLSGTGWRQEILHDLNQELFGKGLTGQAFKKGGEKKVIASIKAELGKRLGGDLASMQVPKFLQ